jgi:hypothetical protein
MDHSVRIEPLSVKGVRLQWPRLFAVHGDALGIIEGRDLLVACAGLGSDDLRTRHVHVLEWAPARIRFSPSLRHMMLESRHGNYVSIVDLESGTIAGEIYAPESVSATLTTIDGKDALICARRPGLLEGLLLPSMARVFAAPCAKPKPYVFTRIETMPDLDSLAIVGHVFLEALDELVLVSVSEMLSDPDLLMGAVHGEARCTTAERITIGIGDEEVPAISEADGAHTLSIWAFASRTLVEKRALDLLGVENATALVTPRAIAIGHRGAISILPRQGGTGAPMRIPARIHGFDTGGNSIVAADDQKLQLLTLP